MKAAGSPITATSEAAIASPQTGLRFHPVLGADALLAPSAPSKRRSAASIAASRAAGRGGGGSGRETESGSAGILGQLIAAIARWSNL
jgi:hypothetical protein